MTKVNPEFATELTKYGIGDFNACFNCGNCTATCSLSTSDSSFPREMIRYTTLGLEDEIRSSLKPWECYYCGECSRECPRKANPGELMMSLRRWLTAQYDWTGLSGLLYRSLTLTVTALLLVAAGVFLFARTVHFDAEALLHTGHRFEMLAIATVFLVIFIPNLFRMWYYTIVKNGVKAPVKRYLTTLSELFVQMFTQKRARDCDGKDNFRWLEHLVLVFAYLSLLFTTVFLNWFGTGSLFIIVLGYVESFLIFVITGHFVSGRIKRNKALNTFSQPSDWLFVIWLLLMGLTAFLVRLFIDLQILEANIWIHLIHLTLLAQWALIIVPFGKWTHFLYRSFGLYFVKIKTMQKPA